MMFLFHNQENKPLKAGRGTEKPMQSYRILRDQAIKSKEVTKKEAVTRTPEGRGKSDLDQRTAKTRGETLVQTVVRSHSVYRYGQDMRGMRTKTITYSSWDP